MALQITSSILILTVSLIVLALSADKFVESAVVIATKYNISPLIIGITIVGFGTSAPEMLVSAIAAFQNDHGIAIGNVVGSNITNIALIVGASALIYPATANRTVIKREMPLMAVVTLFTSIVMLNGYLSRLEGVLFLLIQAGLLFFMYKSARKDSQLTQSPPPSNDALKQLSHPTYWLIGSLILLITSSRFLVWSAVAIATELEISSLVIGLTIIALGTSLPEFAASIAASRKGQSDMVFGNILGSNSFNLLTTLGIAAIISPAKLEEALLKRDIPLMLIITGLFWFFAFKRKQNGMIGRYKGATLLLFYIGYQVLLYISITQAS